MAVPDRHLTVDGFELQMASNVLGPLALTVRLLPPLLAAPGPRVATMSQRRGLPGARRPRPPRRPAPLLARAGLRRLRSSPTCCSPATSPGSPRSAAGTCAAPPPTPATRTPTCRRAGPGLGRDTPRRFQPRFVERCCRSQEVDTGTEPLLVAATDPAAENGSYWGPTGAVRRLVGEPGRARLPARGPRRRARRALLGGRRGADRRVAPRRCLRPVSTFGGYSTGKCSRARSAPTPRPAPRPPGPRWSSR